MDFNGFNMSSATSAVKVAEIAAQTEELARKVGAESLRQEVREQENHDNLNSLANDSQEIITLMKHHIELLEKTNENLESYLFEMTNVLKMIFNIDESQKNQIEQITSLACQIAESLNRGEKINWKDKAADAGIQMTLAGICMALRMRGINI